MILLCGQCKKNEATHFCSACNKWLCSSAICEIQSGLDVLNKKIDQVYKKLTKKDDE